MINYPTPPTIMEMLTRISLVIEDLNQLHDVTVPDFLEFAHPTDAMKRELTRALKDVSVIAVETLEMATSWDSFKEQLREMGIGDDPQV